MNNTDYETYKLNSSDNLPLTGIVVSAAAGALLMYLLDPQRRGGASLRQAGRDAVDSLSSTVQELTHRVTSSAHELSNNVSNSARHAVNDRYDHSDYKSDYKSGYNSASAQPAPLNPGTDWDTNTHGSAVPTPPKPASAASRLIPPALGAMVSPRAGGVAALVQALRDQTWNPRTRNTALLGGALSLYSLFAKRSVFTVGAGMIATALLAKGTQSAVAAANAATAERDLRAGNVEPVQIETSIRIDASPEDVFDMWTNYENFPHFMANVEEVRDLGGDVSHWSVKGPAGTTYEWDSILVEKERGHHLAWRSIPGSKIEQRGEVRLEPVRGGTRATVRMSYTPPAGKAGQAIATLLGSNPKHQLEQDLQRLKGLLERGHRAHTLANSESSRGKSLH